MPFSTEQFFDVFRQYNEAVWPAQWVLIGLALVAIATVVADARRYARGPGMVLAALWVWMGAVYHLLFFRSINPAALLFGAMFLVQAGALVWFTTRRQPPLLQAQPDEAGIAGGALMGFALLVYPLLGYLSGHHYPATPTFGLPCPTTIFTLGLLLWVRPAVPRYLLVIPTLWAIIATSAALQLGVIQDFGLLPAALIALVVSFRSRNRTAVATKTSVASRATSVR